MGQTLPVGTFLEMTTTLLWHICLYTTVFLKGFLAVHQGKWVLKHTHVFCSRCQKYLQQTLAAERPWGWSCGRRLSVHTASSSGIIARIDWTSSLAARVCEKTAHMNSIFQASRSTQKSNIFPSWERPMSVFVEEDARLITTATERSMAFSLLTPPGLLLGDVRS